ncbi:MAG: class I SAM-dependent methyltransferase [Acidobacteriota bacterium]|nr:class I SAM-dependent methyltransferase [Acidobacteriota bacterium]
MPRPAVYGIDEFRAAQRAKRRDLIYCYCDAPQVALDFILREVEEFRGTAGCPVVWELDARNGRPLQDLGKHSGGWDVIYSSNLLSGLCMRAAQQAVRKAVSRLRPGGRLLLSNVSLNAKVQACCVCSHPGMHFRTELELAELTRDIPERTFTGQAVFSDEFGLNAYLELHKRTDFVF